MLSLKSELTTAPAAEPITLSDVKTNLGISDTESDTVIPDYISAARKLAEAYTGKAFINQTWTLTLDYFPDEIELPHKPASSITSIKYYDVDGAYQTLSSANYYLQNKGNYAKHVIVPEYGLSWPSTRDRINAVDVIYVAGYGATAADVPDDIIRALHIIVRGWVHSEAERGVFTPTMPKAAEMLLKQYVDLSF